MSIDVSFLGQDYSFGDDLKEYVDVLRMSEKNSDNLVNAFLSLSKKKGGIIDAAEIKPDLIRKADEYIKMLCNKGVFSKSAEDYVDENNGFKEIEQICAEGVSVYKNILVDEINEFQDGMNDAYSEAASNITGTGVRVYTSSLATLALNSAYEYSVLKGQAKKADAQYKKAIDELSDRTEARSDIRRNDFLRNTYYPRMTDALTLFAFGLVQRYISDLITEGKFDDSVLEYAEIKKSNTLLDNLKHVTDHNSRLECIKQAFEACPFNERVYDTAIDHEVFDSDSFYAAKSFGIGEIIVGKLKNKISFSETADLEKKINSKMKYINAYSICTGTSVSDVLKSSTASIFNSVIMGYRDVTSTMTSNHALYKQTYYLSDDDLLNLQDNDTKERVIKAVKNIVSDRTFDTLINKCGYNSLLKELSDICGDGTYYGNKTDLDNAYVDKIYKKLITEIEKKKVSIRERQKAEEENRLLEEEAAAVSARKAKTTAIVILSIVVVIIAGILVFTVVIPNKKYNDALHLIDIGEYENAITAFTDLNGYKESEDKINEAKYLFAQDKVANNNYSVAKELFESIKNYKDSADMISCCDYNIATLLMNEKKYDDALMLFDKAASYGDAMEQIKECKYRQASELITNSDYDNAIDILKSIKSYKNCNELINECKYNKASEYIISKKYDDAISILTTINNEYDCTNEIIECKYNIAKSLIEAYKYYEAYNILQEIKEYKNSTDLAQNLYLNHEGEIWLGEELDFGKNADGPIKWIVIKKEKDKIMILCKDCVSKISFGDIGFSYSSWSVSPIRKWLNNDFLLYFEPNELNNIIEDNIINSGSNSKSDEGSTKDKIFLLSADEAKELLSDDIKKAAYEGVIVEWWLRTSGINKGLAATVTPTGGIYLRGDNISEIKGVRPAMWIKAE